MNCCIMINFGVKSASFENLTMLKIYILPGEMFKFSIGCSQSLSSKDDFSNELPVLLTSVFPSPGNGCVREVPPFMKFPSTISINI